MESKRKTDKPVEAGGVVRVAAEQLVMVPIDELIPYANNARVHDKRQINQLRASLREFGFVTPLLIDRDNNIIAGHGRLLAAKAEGMTQVPCVLVSELTEAQRRAYILADNRLSETAAWDPALLRIELQGLQALHFDTGITGFEMEDLKRIEVSEYTRAAPGQGQAASGEEHTACQAEPEALDLDEEPEQNRPRACYHCPKCGFEFEVAK
jgi:ParB-like chromosome segregation protein Spo0J